MKLFSDMSLADNIPTNQSNTETSNELPTYRSTMNQTFSESIAKSLQGLDQDLKNFDVPIPTETTEADVFGMNVSEVDLTKPKGFEMNDPWSPESPTHQNTFTD